MKAQPTPDEHRPLPSASPVQSVHSLSLRTRMAFYFGALFAVILLVVSLVRTFGLPWTPDSGSYGLEQALILKQLDLLADLEEERLRLWLDERKHDAIELSERRVVTSSVRNLVQLMHEDVDGARSPDGLKSALLNDKSGKALATALTGLKTSQKAYEKILIVDARNRLIIASTDRSNIGRRLLDSDHSFVVTSQSEDASVAITKSPETGTTQVVISKTIPDRSSADTDAPSTALGTVILYVDGERFLRPFLYGVTKIGESEDIVLVDQDMRILVSPRFAPADGRQARPLEYKVTTEPATLAVQGKGGVLVTRDYRGVPVLSAYRHIPVTSTLGWGLVVKVDRAEMFEPTKRRLFYASVVSFFGVLAASVMAALIAGRIARPIQNLSAVARQVEAGDLNGRAQVSGSDEVRDLAVTFNSMIERIQFSQAGLEEQVKVRTQRLTELNDALTREIQERARAQHERERLIKELETKNAELERFTYTVSHDLSSPLITIKTFVGFVEQAFKEGNTNDVESDLARITRAAEKMGQLLEELLELSRIGRLGNPVTRVPMTEVAREALELLGGTIAERRVEVVVDPDMPAVRGDRPRLLEVFQNLVENALKFTREQPHPTIEIGTGEIDGEPAFYVRDNGEGIDPAYQERIFRLFDKLDLNSEGTGIGLAIVKRIVEVHRGRVWVESRGKGHGSTFWFTLAESGPSDGGE